MTKEDHKALQKFFRKMPLEDRLFLKEDVQDPKVIKSWVDSLDYSRVIPILAEIDGRIIGDATLHRRRFGWYKNVGDIRFVIDTEFRRMGLGHHLAREIFLLAIKLKLETIVAELVDTQKNAIKIFRKLGFKRAAVLKQYVKDITGKRNNLVIMTHAVDTLWDEMHNMIHDSISDKSGYQ